MIDKGKLFALVKPGDGAEYAKIGFVGQKIKQRPELRVIDGSR